MTLVRRRRGLDKKKNESSDDDYGFYMPLETIEELYWERDNSSQVVYPEEGGALDQDWAIMTDIGIYGWLVHEAEKVLDKEKAAEDLVAAQRRR